MRVYVGQKAAYYTHPMMVSCLFLMLGIVQSSSHVSSSGVSSARLAGNFTLPYLPATSLLQDNTFKIIFSSFSTVTCLNCRTTGGPTGDTCIHSLMGLVPILNFKFSSLAKSKKCRRYSAGVQCHRGRHVLGPTFPHFVLLSNIVTSKSILSVRRFQIHFCKRSSPQSFCFIGSRKRALPEICREDECEIVLILSTSISCKKFRRYLY